MRAKLQESESLLNDFYSVGLIYPKYRSLIPMASISEYFEAGRCSTLGEAYNIFEMERKLGTIIDKLDEISSQQRLVYEAVEASDKTIQNMSQTVNRLSNSAYSIQLDAAYAASNTQIIARNSEYQRFLTMIR